MKTLRKGKASIKLAVYDRNLKMDPDKPYKINNQESLQRNKEYFFSAFSTFHSFNIFKIQPDRRYQNQKNHGSCRIFIPDQKIYHIINK
jgi:hypothetical protein